MKKRIKKHIFLSILFFAITACGVGYKEFSTSSNNCDNPVSDSTANVALSQISFSVAPGWTEIKPKRLYATGPSLLNIFIFDSSVTSPKICVETMIEVVSVQSVVDNYEINSSEISVDGIPVIMAVADGYSDSSRVTPFRGIYAGFKYSEWIYVFAWDAFGLDAVRTITDEAIFAIQSVRIAR